MACSKEMHQRHYSFERCFGFRDLGGYATEDGHRVRWGRLFRSMTPQHMSDEDVAHVRDVLGVRSVADLRRGETAVGGPFEAEPFRRKVISFATSGSDMPHETPRNVLVSAVFEGSGEKAVEAIEFFVDGSEAGGAMFHCHTGKDRTGVLAAVILRFLGVSEADVISDYVASADAVAQMRAYAKEQGVFFFPDIPETASPFVMEAPQAYWLRGVMEALRQPGAARKYLEAHGASSELLARFQDWLLE